jgi:hypothetical protein
MKHTISIILLIVLGFFSCKKEENKEVLFAQHDIVDTPNRFLFILGPGIAMSTALITSAVIPWGDTIEVFGQRVLLQATDIDVSVLFESDKSDF